MCSLLPCANGYRLKNNRRKMVVATSQTWNIVEETRDDVVHNKDLIWGNLQSLTLPTFHYFFSECCITGHRPHPLLTCCSLMNSSEMRRRRSQLESGEHVGREKRPRFAKSTVSWQCHWDIVFYSWPKWKTCFSHSSAIPSEPKCM